jgi:uncharacterized protein (DUF983 family)
VVIHSSSFNIVINTVIVIASLAVGIETDNPQWSHVLQVTPQTRDFNT